MDILEENVEAWIQFKNLENSIVDVIDIVNKTQLNTDNIKDVVNTAKQIMIDGNSLDFGFQEGLDFYDPLSHRQEIEYTFPTGYSWIDLMLDGGYRPGNLIVFAGGPKSGKSLMLGNLAVNAIRNGYNTALISLEMRDKRYIRRLGANLLDIPISEYDKFSRNTNYVKERLLSLRDNPSGLTLQVPGNFYIKEYPASVAGVQEIEAYLRKLEDSKRMKLKVVVVDYINIMKNWRNPNTDQTYMKIKQICEDLRAMAQRLEVVVLSGTQLNKSASISSDIDISGISESSGLTATVDGLFGIITPDVLERRESKFRMKALALRDSGGINSIQDFFTDFEYFKVTQGDLRQSYDENYDD